MQNNKKKSRRICIGLITDWKDDILMGCRNDNGKWTNVGGHIEEGEDPYIGMIRECKEESNIDVHNIKLVKTQWNKEKNLLLYLFQITPDPASIITSEYDPDKECDAWYFIDPNEVKEDLHVPLEENILLQYWIEN